jgi:hypothetical protein
LDKSPKEPVDTTRTVVVDAVLTLSLDPFTVTVRTPVVFDITVPTSRPSVDVRGFGITAMEIAVIDPFGSLVPWNTTVFPDTIADGDLVVITM